MANNFQPMLAASKPTHTRFPVLASPKIDGVRAIVRNGVLVSRKLIAIPNLHTQKLFARGALEGFDGELVVGMPNAFDCMQTTMSGVMTIEREPDVRFFVFDTASSPLKGLPYRERLAHVQLRGHNEPKVFVVPHSLVESQEMLDAYEVACLQNGFEGVMLRDPEGTYKWGRSTSREGGLVKVKRFEDAEALVFGFQERMHNGNEATVDALGHTKRTAHHAGLVGHGDLGALVCRVIVPDKAMHHSDPTFYIGTGFTAEQRKTLWSLRDKLLGTIVKFRHFAAAGTKDAPRFPVFVGFRDSRDM